MCGAIEIGLTADGSGCMSNLGVQKDIGALSFY